MPNPQALQDKGVKTGSPFELFKWSIQLLEESYNGGSEFSCYCQNRISSCCETKYSQPLILSNVIFYRITYA